MTAAGYLRQMTTKTRPFIAAIRPPVDVRRRFAARFGIGRKRP
jgi:hypothetical protein